MAPYDSQTFQIVELLLEKGARVDVFDHEGKTALHLAAEQGSHDVCKILLSKNSFVNRYYSSALNKLVLHESHNATAASCQQLTPHLGHFLG